MPLAKPSLPARPPLPVEAGFPQLQIPNATPRTTNPASFLCTATSLMDFPRNDSGCSPFPSLSRLRQHQNVTAQPAPTEGENDRPLGLQYSRHWEGADVALDVAHRSDGIVYRNEIRHKSSRIRVRVVQRSYQTEPEDRPPVGDGFRRQRNEPLGLNRPGCPQRSDQQQHLGCRALAASCPTPANQLRGSEPDVVIRREVGSPNGVAAQRSVQPLSCGGYRRRLPSRCVFMGAKDNFVQNCQAIP